MYYLPDYEFDIDSTPIRYEKNGCFENSDPDINKTPIRRRKFLGCVSILIKGITYLITTTLLFDMWIKTVVTNTMRTRDICIGNIRPRQQHQTSRMFFFWVKTFRISNYKNSCFASLIFF